MPEALSDHGVSWKVYQTPGTSVGPQIKLALADGFNVLLYFKQYVSHPHTDLYQRAFFPSWPNDFMNDIRSGTLPRVSWVLPPIAYSEHPNSSPAAGQWMTSQVLAALTQNPEVWSKTVLFVNYDENGGFFDHVVPPTPSTGEPGEVVPVPQAMVQGSGIGGPIGLGFRVPMLVLSPWSRGGWVDSGTYDHTSTLRFLEKRWGVPIPNLTSWRRKTVGDLTSTLGFGKPTNTSVPALPATSLANLGSACPTTTNIGAFLSPPIPVTVPNPGNQQLPPQEPGAAHRR
jgi:phospholipase C